MSFGRPALALGLIALWACGGTSADDHDLGQADPIVGAQCLADSDCDETCVRGERFPQGMCTLTCQSDDDCPADAACIADEGGVCAFTCDDDEYCREVLDDRYDCGERDDVLDRERHVCVGED